MSNYTQKTTWISTKRLTSVVLTASLPKNGSGQSLSAEQILNTDLGHIV